VFHAVIRKQSDSSPQGIRIYKNKKLTAKRLGLGLQIRGQRPGAEELGAQRVLERLLILPAAHMGPEGN
jgi:hypothetical protein